MLTFSSDELLGSTTGAGKPFVVHDAPAPSTGDVDRVKPGDGFGHRNTT